MMRHKNRVQDIESSPEAFITAAIDLFTREYFSSIVTWKEGKNEIYNAIGNNSKKVRYLLVTNDFFF